MSIKTQYQEFLSQKREELFGDLIKIQLLDDEGVCSDEDDNEVLIRIIQYYILNDETTSRIDVDIEEKGKNMYIMVKKLPMLGCLMIGLTPLTITFKLDKAEWYRPVTFSSEGIEPFITAFFDYYPELKDNILFWLKHSCSKFVVPKRNYLNDTFVNII